jgi:hypothetical protein
VAKNLLEAVARARETREAKEKSAAEWLALIARDRENPLADLFVDPPANPWDAGSSKDPDKTC